MVESKLITISYLSPESRKSVEKAIGKVRSFTEFLNKFEKDFGKETLKLARRHKRSWNCLLWLYVRNIPINVNTLYSYLGCVNVQNNGSLQVFISKDQSIVDTLAALVHETVHCLDLWNTNPHLIWNSAGNYIKIFHVSEIKAHIQEAMALEELLKLSPTCPLHFYNSDLLQRYRSKKSDKEFAKYVLIDKGYISRFKKFIIGPNRLEPHNFPPEIKVLRNDFSHSY